MDIASANEKRLAEQSRQYLIENGWTPKDLPPQEIIRLADDLRLAEAKRRCPKLGVKARGEDPECLRLACPGEPGQAYALGMTIGAPECIIKAILGKPEHESSFVNAHGESKTLSYFGGSFVVHLENGKMAGYSASD